MKGVHKVFKTKKQQPLPTTIQTFCVQVVHIFYLSVVGRHISMPIVMDLHDLLPRMILTVYF